MGITIHYAVPRYPMLMGNGRIPDDPFTGFIQQAEQLAQEVLNNLEFPHRIHRFDRRDSQDQSRPQLNQSQGGNYILERWQRHGRCKHQCVGSGL